MKRKDTTENICPFFKKRDNVKWTIKDSTLYVGTWGEFPFTDRIACFDFDGTLAGVKGTHIVFSSFLSSSKYPKHGDDWIWIHESVPKVLKTLHEKGYSIVIMSNQRNMLDSKNEKRKLAFTGRIQNVCQALEDVAGYRIPIRIYAASGDDKYRKPRTGMMTALLNDYQKMNKPLDLTFSFYAGDAAGRLTNWTPGHNEDFADTDHKFALNSNLTFYVPEHLFHAKSLDSDVSKTDSKLELTTELLQKTNLPLCLNALPDLVRPHHPHNDKPLLPCDCKELKSDNQKLIILVGPPASGKSFYRKRNLPENIKYVNQDELKTKQKCIKETQLALESGQSVVVDNTNPDEATRAEYINLAKKQAIPIYCVYFDLPEELCLHNNAYREFHLNEKKKVPSVAYRTFYSKLQKPKEDEGFRNIFTYTWNPQFEKIADYDAWKLYYT